MRKLKPRKKIVLLLFLIILSVVIILVVNSNLYEPQLIEKETKSMLTLNDIKLSIFLDGEKTNQIPSQTNIFQELNCSKQNVLSWNEDKNTLSVYEIEKTDEEIICSIHFSSKINTGELNIDLVDGMIPVAFDGDGKTIKADIENANNNWYDYDNFMWANMVLVSEESRDTYKKIGIGKEILEDDILAYFVWIPRYKYLLFNTENNAISEKTITVEFESKDTKKSSGEVNGEWLTHPAFTFGEVELEGFWIGKFMTNPDEDSLCHELSNETNCNNTNITPMIKPNMDAWRNIDVANLFTIAQYIKSDSKYGISNSSSDSHMIKNMEWGAVAYLSQSKYGKRENSSYSGVNIEVYSNNYRIGASKYATKKVLTGCSSGLTGRHNLLEATSTCNYTYPDMSLSAVGASTTGTIYGVYDMSGSSMEYVMGNMVNSKGEFFLGKSSSNFGTFGSELPSKYYDSYAYSTSPTTHSRGYLGDATREIIQLAGEVIGGWYYDASYFPDSSVPWFTRGGHASSGAWAGVFRFVRDNGEPSPINTTRIVIVKE